MSRFACTTLLALATLVTIGFMFSGQTQMLAFCVLWTVYLTIVGCGVVFIRMSFFGPVVCRGRVGGMKIALTFDDGPDPVATAALLDLLRRENISAAFFCIGRNVSAHPGLAARIAAEGHLLGNHTYNHFWWTALLGRRGLTREIELTQVQIRESTGVTPLFMRPPIGLTNPHFAGVLRRAGLTMVGWDVRSMDLSRPPAEVIERVLARARDGSIILLHDAGGSSPDRIMEIVSVVVSALQARGFEFERLDRLID